MCEVYIGGRVLLVFCSEFYGVCSDDVHVSQGGVCCETVSVSTGRVQG